MLAMAKLFCLQRLRSVAFDHIMKNIADIVNSDDIEHLDEEDFADLLSNEAVQWTNEEAKFEALQKWSKTDESKPMKSPTLVAQVDLRLVSKTFFVSVVASEELMQKPNCMKFYKEALQAESIGIMDSDGVIWKLVGQEWRKLDGAPLQCEHAPLSTVFCVGDTKLLVCHCVMLSCLTPELTSGRLCPR
jgi:hypothetical protein